MSLGICFLLSLLDRSGSLSERILRCLWPPPLGAGLQKVIVSLSGGVFKRGFPRTSKEHFRSHIVVSGRVPRAFSHLPNEMFGFLRACISDIHIKHAYTKTHRTCLPNKQVFVVPWICIIESLLCVSGRCNAVRSQMAVVVDSHKFALSLCAVLWSPLFHS